MYARHIKSMAAAAVASILLVANPVAAKEVNIVAFAPGFAWANLFGPSGTEKPSSFWILRNVKALPSIWSTLTKVWPARKCCLI